MKDKHIPNTILSKEQKIKKLKKYLFLISILFFIMSLTHLSYKYLFNDSELIPLNGGKVSEGLVGQFPSLNPLRPLEGNNKYIINILYRNILKYSLDENKISGDLASCDISNLESITCYLKENIKWSDGKDITTDDIVSTYQILKKPEINPITSSLLEKTTIKSEDNSIVFVNKGIKDINFLNIFFQPILPKELLDNMDEDQLRASFLPIDQVYSGKLKIIDVSTDQNSGMKKLILEKNEFYENNDILIDQYIIKLFPDYDTFLNNKDTVNIFNDNKNILGNSIPRFHDFKYSLPRYVSMYLNKDNLEDDKLRNFILNSVPREDLLNNLGNSSYKEVLNPYITDKNIDTAIQTKNKDELFAKLGYYKKEKLIQDIIPEKKEKLNYSEELKTRIKNSEDKLENFQKPSTLITSPTYVEKYNFVSKNNILLTGNVPSGVTEVTVNDYTLKGFKAGNSVFHYRISTQIGNLKKGKNAYKIYFTKDGKKEEIEEIIFYYDFNKTALANHEEELLKELIEQKIKKELDEEVKKESEKKPELNKDRLTELSKLDDKYYYNDKYERFSLNLYYVATEADLEKTANFVKNNLENKGININLNPITINSLRKVVSEKEKYDILITGINLGYFEQNIFPYYHSSQVKNGFNFTSVRKTGLDIALEDLKENILTSEKEILLKDQVLNVIKEEQVLKTLYSPELNLYVDKYIKNAKLKSYLPNKSIRSEILSGIYVKEEKNINFENKSINNFIRFLLKIINE